MITQLMVLLLGAGLLVRWAPGLPLSRFLERRLAAAPARWLAGRSRRELLAWALMAALVAFAGEYVLLIGGPQVAIGVAIDLASYIDALVAVATLASAARFRSAARWFTAPVRRPARRNARRLRRKRSRPTAANDDEGGPGQLAA